MRGGGSEPSERNLAHDTGVQQTIEEPQGMPMTRNLLLTVSALVAAGCGMGVASPDVGAYQQSLSELQAAVITHQNDAASTVTSQDCTSEHRRYEDVARHQLGQMTNMSGGMDNCGRAMGHAGPFDLASTCGSMQNELDRHASEACRGDAAANHAEAARHCQVMRDWLAREQVGVDSMSRMGGMMGGGRCSR